MAERYYRKKNDILKKGARGQVQDGNPMRSADNRIPANFYNILVNQKASYLFTHFLSNMLIPLRLRIIVYAW